LPELQSGEARWTSERERVKSITATGDLFNDMSEITADSGLCDKCKEILRLRTQRSRKKNVAESRSDELGRCGVARERLPDKPVQFETKKVGEFRMLVLPEQGKEEPMTPTTKPLIFRDDNGRVISERAWNALQKLKEKAKENEYEIDDYIQ
jgi:hypothetical protein